MATQAGALAALSQAPTDDAEDDDEETPAPALSSTAQAMGARPPVQPRTEAAPSQAGELTWADIAKEEGRRLRATGLFGQPGPPDRGLAGQVVAGVQRGLFGTGATFGDALALAMPDTGKAITDFFHSFQMQSSGKMLEHAVETATTSTGVLGVGALGALVAGAPTAAAALAMSAAPIAPVVFGLAQATETRNLLHAANEAIVKQGGTPLTSGEIAEAMAATGAAAAGGQFLIDRFLVSRFAGGSTAAKNVAAAVQPYLLKAETNAALKLVAKATEESVRAGIAGAAGGAIQAGGTAAATRGVMSPEQLAQAQEGGAPLPGTPLEEAAQAARIGALAGPFFAAGGAISARVFGGRRGQTPPPQETSSTGAQETARQAAQEAPEPIIAPTVPSPATRPAPAPQEAPGGTTAGIPGAPRRQAPTPETAVNPLTGEGVEGLPASALPRPPTGAGETGNPLTGEQVAAATPPRAATRPEARYAETPVIGVRPRADEAETAQAPEARLAPTLSADDQQALGTVIRQVYPDLSARDLPAEVQRIVQQNPASLEEAIRLVLQSRERQLEEGGRAQVAPSVTREQAAPAAPQPPEAPAAETQPPVAPVQPAAVTQPPAEQGAAPAQPTPEQPATGQQQLVDVSGLQAAEAATQGQITREGAEAEAQTRLRPTVEQAPPSGLFEQEQELPLGEPRQGATATAETPEGGEALGRFLAEGAQAEAAGQPDLLDVIRGEDQRGRRGLRVEGSDIATEFQEAAGIKEGGREAVSGLINNRSGTPLAEMVEQARAAGFLSDTGGEHELLRALTERLSTGKPYYPRYAPGGVFEGETALPPVPGGERPEVTPAERQAAAEVPARLQRVAEGESIVSVTTREPSGRTTHIPGVKRPEGSIEVARAISPNAVIQELQQTGHAVFQGQTVRAGAAGSRDIAVLGRLARDPQVEHLHRLLLDDEGTVLRVKSVSSRLPGSAAPFEPPLDRAGVLGTGERQTIAALRADMAAVGATRVRDVHNHPSRDVTPSAQDIAYTQQLARVVPGYEGHTVIDHGQFSHIDPAGHVTTERFDPGGPDPFHQPSLGEPLTHLTVLNARHAADVGQALAQPGFVSLLLLNKHPEGTGLQVRGALLVPEQALTAPFEQAQAYVQQLKSEFGATVVTTYYEGTNPGVARAAQLLQREGVLRDHVSGVPRTEGVQEEPGGMEELRRMTEERVAQAGGDMFKPVGEWVGEATQGLEGKGPQTAEAWEGVILALRRALYEHYTRGGTFETLPAEVRRAINRARRAAPLEGAPAEALEELANIAVRGTTAIDSVPWLMRPTAIGPRFQLTPPGFSETGRPLGGVHETPPSLPEGEREREPVTHELRSTIEGVTVAQVNKAALAYKMMAGLAAETGTEGDLSRATLQKLVIPWPKTDAMGENVWRRWQENPAERSALFQRIERDPTANMSPAESYAWRKDTEIALHDLREKLDSGALTQEAYAHGIDAIVKLDMLMPSASAVGRALQYQQRFGGGGELVGMARPAEVVEAIENARGRALTTEERRAAVQQFDDARARGDEPRMRAMMDQEKDPTLLDYYKEVYYGSMLSGLPTHVVKITSELAHITFQNTVVKGTEAAMDAVLSRLSGRARQVYMDEVTASLGGMWRNFTQAYQEAWYWWKAPLPQAIGGQGTYEVARPGLLQGVSARNTELDMGPTAWQRAPLQHADGTPNQWGPVMRRLAPFVGAAQRAFTAVTWAAQRVAKDGEVDALATRQAHQELGPTATREQIERYVQDVRDNPDRYQPLHAMAQQRADVQTFQDAPGMLSQALGRLHQAPQPLGFFLWLLTPFKGVPDRLLARGLELVPGVGLPVGLREADITWRGFLPELQAGTPRALEVASKQVVGLMLSGMAVAAYQNGLITGPLPTDATEREAWLRTGKEPFAMAIGDRYVSYRRIEPFVGFPVGMVASAVDAIQKIQDRHAKEGTKLNAASLEDATAIAAAASWGMTRFVLDGSYFQGLANFFGSVSKSGSPATGLRQQLVSATLPLSGLLRTLNRTLESSGALGTEPGLLLLRENRTLGEAYARNIPGLAQQVEPRRDVFGQPIVSETPILGPVGGLLSPIRRTTVTNDPVEQLFRDVGYEPGRQQQRQVEQVMGRKLDTEEFTAYTQRRGELAREQLERLAGLEFFQNLPKDRQVARIKQIFSGATRRARQEILGRPETPVERRERLAAAGD